MSKKLNLSILAYYTKDELEEVLFKCNTFSDMLRYLGLRASGGNYRTLRKALTFHNIDFSKIKQGLNNGKGRKYLNYPGKLLNEQIFVENSLHSRGCAKDRIVRDNLIEYKCEQCGQGNEWNNKKLVLVLDHINGIHNDHRLENLRFLCPNCNAQQDTFAGKQGNDKRQRIKKEKYAIKIKEKLQKENIRMQSIKERIERIKQYNIDYTKHGWVGEVAKLENMLYQKVNIFMKKYMPEFYENCFKRKSINKK